MTPLRLHPLWVVDGDPTPGRVASPWTHGVPWLMWIHR